MAQAKHVPIPIRARITGASLTTSTKTYDAPAARNAARRIGLNQTRCDLLADATSAHKRAVPVVSRRVA